MGEALITNPGEVATPSLTLVTYGELSGTDTTTQALSGSKLTLLCEPISVPPVFPVYRLRRLAMSHLATMACVFAAGHGAALAAEVPVQRLISFGGTCVGCVLTKRKLPGSRFMGANFTQANFQGTDLRGAEFIGSNFSHANLAHADVRGATMFGSQFTLANLEGAHLDGLAGQGANLAGANLDHARFTDAALMGADLRQVRAKGALFDQVNFVGAHLQGGRFSVASFRGARLNGADLTGGEFSRADFRDADLTGAYLYASDLRGARNLTQAQLDEACGDAATRVERPLRVRPCQGHRIVIRIRP